MQPEIRKNLGSAFKNMIVWQRAMEVAIETYTLTRLLPKEEMFGLTSQMRRSAVSIASNIAEGSKRGTKKDFLQFLRIAAGSAAELETQILIAQNTHAVRGAQKLISILGETERMLESLMRKL